MTIGAPNPRELAEFYVGLLGWSVAHDDPPGPGEPPEAGWAQIKPPAGSAGPTLNFEYEAHYAPPAWPSEAGRQHITQHLDIWVKELEAAVAWATAAGARLADHQPQDDVRVMLDPAGHPFCFFV